MSSRCLPSSFGSIWLAAWEKMWFEEFQNGGHLGYWNRRILAILNFHNTPYAQLSAPTVSTAFQLRAKFSSHSLRYLNSVNDLYFQYFTNKRFVSLSAERSVTRPGIGWFSPEQTLLLNLTGGGHCFVCVLKSDIYNLSAVCSTK